MPWHERKLVGELENRTVRQNRGNCPGQGNFYPSSLLDRRHGQFPAQAARKVSHSAVKRSYLTTNQEGVGKTVQWFGSRSTGLTPRFHAE